MTTTPETSRDFTYHQHRLDRVKPICLEAIETMRRYLDDAVREVNRETTAPEEAVSIVTSKIAWGLANASGNLASAMSALEDARKAGEQS